MRRYSKPRNVKLPPFARSTILLFSSFISTLSLANSSRSRCSTALASLSPCYPYHPAGVSCRLGPPAPCHAAFAPKQRARPPDLSFVSRPPMVLLSLWPGDLLTIL